jgi:MarR family transcriptional regulator for hemolysin
MKMPGTKRSSARRIAALMAFGSALPALQRSYRAAADKAVNHIGLSQAMAWPLVMIGRQGDGVRPGVLAELLAIEGASLVRQLDQLVEAGLIERREHPVDRRAKTLHLTPAGSAARAGIESALETMRSALFDGIDDADIDAALRVFGALQGRLSRAGRAGLGLAAERR